MVNFINVGIASLVYAVIFAIIHVLFMAASATFAMGHPGLFLAAFLTGGVAHVFLKSYGHNLFQNGSSAGPVYAQSY